MIHAWRLEKVYRFGLTELGENVRKFGRKLADQQQTRSPSKPLRDGWNDLRTNGDDLKFSKRLYNPIFQIIFATHCPQNI